MALRTILPLACILTSSALLATGNALAGQGMALAAALAALLAGILAQKWPSTALSTTALILAVAAAAGGMLAGALALLMMPGAVLALAGWDLSLFAAEQKGSAPGKTLPLLESKHYRSLALALGSGLLAAVAGSLIHLQIPFIGMVILALLAIFSLDRIWKSLIE